jgi:hypothetical protein
VSHANGSTHAAQSVADAIRLPGQHQRHERHQREASAAQAAQLGDPADALHLQWVQREDQCRHPGCPALAREPLQQHEGEQRIRQVENEVGGVKRAWREADRVADRGVLVRANLSEVGDEAQQGVGERDVELLVGALPQAGQAVQRRWVEEGVGVDVNVVVEPHEAGGEQAHVDQEHGGEKAGAEADARAPTHLA